MNIFLFLVHAISFLMYLVHLLKKLLWVFQLKKIKFSIFLIHHDFVKIFMTVKYLGVCINYDCLLFLPVGHFPSEIFLVPVAACLLNVLCFLFFKKNNLESEFHTCYTCVWKFLMFSLGNFMWTKNFFEWNECVPFD